MAITEDASTPAIATGTGTGNLVSASFSPPAGSRLEVMVAGQWGSGVSPGITLADSVGGSYLNPVSAVNAAGSARGAVKIFTRYLAAAPGAMTVTASFDAGLAGGRHLAVRVLNGTDSDQTGAATATRDVSPGSSTWTTAIVTTEAGSQVYGVGDDPIANTALTAGTGSTLVGTSFQNGTDATASAIFKATSLTGTPGSTTLGLNCGVSEIGVIAMHEVLPGNGAAPNAGVSFNAPGLPGMPPGPFGMFWQPMLQGSTEADVTGPITGTLAGSLQPIAGDFTGTSDLLRTNNAEAGTPAATVTTADTGSGDQWDAVTIGSGASVVYSTTPDLAGVVGITYDVGVTSSSAFTQWTVGNTATPFVGMRFSYSAQYGGTCSIMSLNQGGTAYIRVQVTAANKLRVLDAAGATLYTSTVTLTPGAKYFLAAGFVAAVAGTYQIKLYDATGTVIETVSPTAGDFTAATNIVRFGSVANQTNASWKATTMDEFYFSSTTMPVPSDQSVLAGTVAGVTGAFTGASKGNATLVGTVAGVTADINGTVKQTGTLAGSTQSITADLNATGKGLAVLAGTVSGVTADLNGTSKGTAALAGTVAGVTADLNGTVKQSGTLAGTVHVVTADINGTSKATGALAGTVAGVTADLNGTSKASAALAGTLHNVTGTIAATAKDNGVLAGSLGSIAGDFNGTFGSPPATGVLAGTVHGVTADLNGTSKSSAALAGTVSAVTADLNGTSKASAILAGTVTHVTGDLNGTSKGTGVLAGTVTHVTGDLNGTSKGTGVLAGTVSGVTADLNGTGKSTAVLAGTVAGVTADLNGTSKASGPLAGTVSNVTGKFYPRSLDDPSDMMVFFHSTYGLHSYSRE